MGDIANIDDHRAWTCQCGSAKFNLLRSSKIECDGCGMKFGMWDAGAMKDDTREKDEQGPPVPLTKGSISSFVGFLPFLEENSSLTTTGKRITLSNNLDNIKIVRRLLVPGKYYAYVDKGPDYRVIGEFERSE